MEQFEDFMPAKRVNSCSTKQTIERKRCLSGFGFLFCAPAFAQQRAEGSARRASKAETIMA